MNTGSIFLFLGVAFSSIGELCLSGSDYQMEFKQIELALNVGLNFFLKWPLELGGSNPLSDISNTPLGCRNMSFLVAVMEKRSLIV